MYITPPLPSSNAYLFKYKKIICTSIVHEQYAFDVLGQRIFILKSLISLLIANVNELGST